MKQRMHAALTQAATWRLYRRLTLDFLLLPLLAFIAAIRLRTLEDPFHGDDFVAFTEFKTTSFFGYVERVFLFQDANFYWRPLGKLAHRVLFEAAGFDPEIFRLFGLIVFLLTLVALYAFVRGERLQPLTALLAVAILGVTPNHVVSVAWVTDTSRLMGVLFLILSLLALQRLRSGNMAPAGELLAALLFLFAALSDETMLALAPLPALYGAVLRDSLSKLRVAVARSAIYVSLVAVLVPMQFSNTLNDEPRLAQYGVGDHIVTQAWALASQLALPLTSPGPVDIILKDIPVWQWTAGIAVLASCVFLFVFGSNRMRFLVAWLVGGLAPFTLWDLTYTSPRYVYVAAVPFAIILAWSIVAVTSWLVARWERIGRWRFAVQVPIIAGVLIALALAGRIATTTTIERNEAWSVETGKYGDLQEGLLAFLPSLPAGARVIIYNGDWPDFWATAVAQSVYGDRSIQVVVIPPSRLNSSAIKLGPRDYVLYYRDPRVSNQLFTTGGPSLP